MKKITIVFLLIIYALAGNAQDISKAVNLEKYKEDNAAIKKTVVFIGNSITQGWADSRPEFFADNGYIGRGIGGQTSPQLLLRFRHDVINLHPAAVVINIGTNDIAQNTGEYNPDFTKACIQSMAELADYNGIKVILSSVTPAGEYPWRKEITYVAQKIDELNDWIKRYAWSKGFEYIDYNKPMRDSKGAMIKEYTTDGVHVTATGYAIMEKLAKEKIDEVLAY